MPEVIKLPESYINYQQVDELLKSYYKLGAIVESLRVELQSAYVETAEDEGEVIYALVVGNRRLDGMSKRSSCFSDKTSHVAFIYKNHIEASNNARIKRLSREILEISMVLEKIDIAFNSLEKTQQEVIDICYFQKKNIDTLNLLEERRIKKEKRRALEDIATVMRLPEKTFYEIIEKLASSRGR